MSPTFANNTSLVSTPACLTRLSDLPDAHRPPHHRLRRGVREGLSATSAKSGLPAGTHCGNDNGMSTTITLGKSGRIVVPKSVRDLLNLREGSRLRLEVFADKLEVTPEPDEVRMEKRGKRRVVVGWKGFDAAKAVTAAREEYLGRFDGPRRK